MNPGTSICETNDWDGDRLSQALENDLRTCDRTTSPNPSPGFTCASRWDCAGYSTSEACRGALRDTDHDGLSDYLEVYEYDDPLMRVSLWGADPARMDLFMELDSADQDTGDGSLPGCQSFLDPINPSSTTRRFGVGGDQTSIFFDRIASTWANGPTSINPDGTAGLAVHYDAGITNPNPEDTRWGNWGGGGTCVACASPAGIRDGACPGFASIRRSAFFYSTDNYSGFPGQAFADSFFAINASHHVHELGHVLVAPAGHAGPRGSTAEVSNDFGNYRASYLTRLNYRYEGLGNQGGDLAAEWDLMSLSRGWLGRNVDGWAGMIETCPAGAGVNIGAVGASTVILPNVLTVTGTSPTQCWNIDWNGSGSVTDAPTVPRFDSVHGRTGNRLLRRSEWTDGVAGFNFYTPRRGLADMTTSGDVLIYAWTQRDSGGVYRVRWRGESNADCNELPFPRSASLQLTHPEFYTAGSYPGCYRPGTQHQFGLPAIQADAVAVERQSVDIGSGNTSPGVVFVHNNAGTLRFSSFAVAPASNAQEFVFSTVVLDSSMRPLGVNVTNASTQYSRREPALVQIPSTLETLLVYVDSAGMLRQSSLSFGASQFWLTPTQSLHAGSPIASERSVSMVTVGQEVWMASPTPTTIRLFRLSGTNVPPAGSRSWELMATLPYATLHRPNLAAVRDLMNPSLTRLVVLFTEADSYYYRYASSSAGTSALAWSTGWTLEYFSTNGARSPSAGAAVWDDRPVVAGFQDLRATIEYPAFCSSDAACRVADGERPALDPTSTCNAAGHCTLGGDPYVNTDFAPFSRGPAPGIYADYDDWQVLQYNVCAVLARQPSLPGRPALVCGALPQLPEPGPLPVLSLPPLDDVAVNAWRYTSQPRCQRSTQCNLY
jgi:hypothetical protein